MSGRRPVTSSLVVASALLALAPAPARAQEAMLDDHLQRPSSVVFHEKAILDRGFKYRDDYFMSVLSYRPRYPLRVMWRLASTGYALTVGSVSTSDFLLDQDARVRLPFASWFIGEFDFIQGEDYDERFLRATVEATILVPGTSGSPPSRILSFRDNTPPPWGLFVGGAGELNAFKEFDDIGLNVGYRNRIVGLKLEATLPEFKFNDKNRSGGKIEGTVAALLGQLELALTGSGPYFSAWGHWQPRVNGSFPEESLRQGSIEKARFGTELVVPVTRAFVIDIDWLGESTRKRRGFAGQPERDDRFAREAGQLWVEANLYLGDRIEADEVVSGRDRLREPTEEELELPWAERPPESRRGLGPELDREWVVPRDVLARTTPANWATTDVIDFGLFAQSIQEATSPRGGVGPLRRTRRFLRREVYGFAGYLLTLPGITPGLAVHPAAYVGYLDSVERASTFNIQTKRDHGVLAKLNGAIEYRFNDKAVAVFNATLRVDKLEFGGGNVQVVLRF